MRVIELLGNSSRRRLALGTLVSVVGLAGCDALKPPEACSVTIAPQNITVGVNSSTPVVGTAFDCDGSTLRNKKVSFSSNNSLIATVTPEGQVIGVAVGQTQISATSNGKSASAQVTVVPEAAATVTISPAPYVLRVNSTKAFTAVAKNSRAEVIQGRTFTWSSSNSSIASVDGNGNVTGHAVGNVTIGAMTDNITGTVNVQVTLPPIGSCSLAPTSRKLTVTAQFQPTLTLRDTTPQQGVLANRQMLWSSDNEVNATVTNSGVITARKAGFATITAAWPENTSIKCEISVEAVDPRIVTATIQQRNQTLRLGIPKQFTVQLLDSVNNVIPPGRPFTFSSPDPSILNVSPGGLVTGIALGTGRVRVEAEGVTDEVSVTVTKIPVAKVTLSPTQPSVIQGNAVTLTATVEDSVGNIVTDRVIEWSSSDPVRATVTPTGPTTATVQTFGNGTVTITATSEGRSGQSQVIIQQVAADSVVVPQTTYTFAQNAVNKSFSYTVRDAAGNQLFGRTVSVVSSDPSVARVQGGASTVNSGTINIDAANPGTATFTLRALNSLNQPEGKTTTVTITITPP
jgi:uncharacterized protein YjdB